MFSSTTHNNLQLLTRALILLIKIKTNALLALCLRPNVFFIAGWINITAAFHPLKTHFFILMFRLFSSVCLFPMGSGKRQPGRKDGGWMSCVSARVLFCTFLLELHSVWSTVWAATHQSHSYSSFQHWQRYFSGKICYPPPNPPKKASTRYTECGKMHSEALWGDWTSSCLKGRLRVRVQQQLCN